MVSPLDFSLDGLDDTQRAAVERFRRGAEASQFKRRPGAPISGRDGPGRPSIEARQFSQASQPRPTPQPQRPAAPPAAQAPKQSFGQKALSLVKSSTSLNPLKNPLLKATGAATAVTAAAGGVVDAARRTDAESAARQADLTTRQLGLDPSGPVGRGVRFTLDSLQSGFENLPVLPGLLNVLAGRPYSDDQPSEAQPVEQAAAQPARPAAARAPQRQLADPTIRTPARGSAEYRRANDLLNSRQVPGYGVGVVKNDQTGAITTIDSQEYLPFAPAAPAAPEFAQAPTLSTDGGIFSALSKFSTDAGAAARQNAAATRYRGDQRTLAEADAERSKSAIDTALRLAGIQVQQQRADTEAAAAAARDRNGSVVTAVDAAGNPVLINKATGVQRRPTVIPTFEEFSARMLEDAGNSGLTPDQLQAIYIEQFGGA